MVGAVLVEDDLGSAALRAWNEADLGVDSFEEIVGGRFGEEFELGLARGLKEKMIAFARDGENEIRGELIAANVAIEQFGIDGNFLVLLGGVGERDGSVE